MSIYKPSLLDKFKDFVNGLKGNWDQYEDHVADFVSHQAESANKHITESGENENGRYIRFDDGTQICTRVRADVNRVSSSRYGQNIRFSAAFVDINYAVSCTVQGLGGYLGAYGVFVTKNNEIDIAVNIYGSNFPESTTAKVDLIAVGRWK